MLDDPQPLSFASGPLVWIDCEMTGLDVQTDKILEIAVSISWVPFVTILHDALPGPHHERKLGSRGRRHRVRGACR